MGIEADLYSHLDDNLSCNIYANKAPQGEKEFLLITKIYKDTEYSHDGNSGLCYADYQFDIYSARKDHAIDIRQALEGEIDGYTGNMGDTTLQGVFLTNEFDGYEEGANLHRETQEYTIQYQE